MTSFTDKIKKLKEVTLQYCDYACSNIKISKCLVTLMLVYMPIDRVKNILLGSEGRKGIKSRLLIDFLIRRRFGFIDLNNFSPVLNLLNWSLYNREFLSIDDDFELIKKNINFKKTINSIDNAVIIYDSDNVQVARVADNNSKEEGGYSNEYGYLFWFENQIRFSFYLNVNGQFYIVTIKCIRFITKVGFSFINVSQGKKFTIPIVILKALIVKKRYLDINEAFFRFDENYLTEDLPYYSLFPNQPIVKEIIKPKELSNSINLIGKSLGYDGAYYLEQSLRFNVENITVIYLSNNQIGDEGCKHICKLIMNCKKILQCYLKWNNFTDSSAKDICQVLEKHNTLNELYLSKNRYTDLGVKEILKSLDKSLNSKLVDIRKVNISNELFQFIKENIPITKVIITNEIN